MRRGAACRRSSQVAVRTHQQRGGVVNDEEKTMTKSELIARLAERNQRLVARDADEAVKTILDAMSAALAAGNRIEIRGFGSFALNYRPPRIGRNPKSGERVPVPAKHVPHFKAGKELRERVDATAAGVQPAPATSVHPARATQTAGD